MDYTKEQKNKPAFGSSNNMENKEKAESPLPQSGGYQKPLPKKKATMLTKIKGILILTALTVVGFLALGFVCGLAWWLFKLGFKLFL